jgi:hypothetical protein
VGVVVAEGFVDSLALSVDFIVTEGRLDLMALCDPLTEELDDHEPCEADAELEGEDESEGLPLELILTRTDGVSDDNAVVEGVSV